MVGQKPTDTVRVKRFERLRHVIWAGLIALALTIPTVLDPVDQVLWVGQSRAISSEPSGDILYIGSERDLTDPNFANRREQLANLINRLDDAGVGELYVDGVFDQATVPEIDAALNQALREFSGESYLVETIDWNANRQDEWHRSLPIIANDVQLVGADLYRNYLGYAWEDTYTVEYQGRSLPNVSAQIAGVMGDDQTRYPINYSFPLTSIPSLTFTEASDENRDLADLVGKTVVIGSQVPSNGVTFDTPGNVDVSPTLIHILAAETLIAGKTRFVPGIYVAIIAFLLLAVIGQLRPPKIRRAGYAIALFALPATFVVTGYLGWRTGLADAIFLYGLYGVFRLRSQWKDSFALVDLETNLPSFAALESDDDVAESVPAIIVAKIHRFEQVRRTLPKELHAEYVLRITRRLKAATQDATIYLGQGHMIAWTMQEKDPALLREHLEGLRALFSSPLLVGDQQVDVGISFGVDITPSPNVTRRLASAVAVAEQTNETYEPIAIADTTSDEDLIWNISLQARIDAALANREIYLVFQPKVMVQTGEIVGVEALVRWKDPVKGHIPPDSFIRQCETAGRMSQLTRFVLEEACKAGIAFADKGLHLPVAVNISATLVHERAIVHMVSDVLETTGFEPRHLTLELTETYRISNIDRAAEILRDLHALGTKISMDDFGVGAASLEALLRLPFSELKIDRAFISQITVSPKALGIVRNVLQMGKDLRIIVVAEGVEDAGTLTLLRDSGCLVAQGFAISRPIDFDGILRFQKLEVNETIKNMV